MCTGLPDIETQWSATGTVLHDLAAMCLQFDLDPYSFVGQTFRHNKWEVKIERADARKMLEGIDRILDFGGQVYVEKRVSFERWSEGDFGTLDIGVITKKEIIIADWKWGAGETVEVERNKQLMIYALAFWWNIARHKTKATRFRLIIMQPNVEGGGGEWTVDLDDLLEFGEEVKRRSAATRKPDARIKPGKKQCRWCKAAQHNTCEAYTQFNWELLGLDMDDLDEAAELDVEPTPPKRALTPKQRSFIVQHADMFKRWLESLRIETLKDALAGDPTPGLKAVHGRKGPRQWDEDKKERVEAYLTKILGEDAFTKTLRSPTQAEEFLTSDQFAKVQPFITQSDGNPALVPVSDRREAITPNAIEFEDLDIETND